MRFLTCMADALIRAIWLGSLRYFKTCLDLNIRNMMHLELPFANKMRAIVGFKLEMEDTDKAWKDAGMYSLSFSIALEHRILTNPR